MNLILYLWEVDRGDDKTKIKNAGDMVNGAP